MKASDLRIGNYVSVKESELKSFLDDYGLQGIENSFEVVSIDNVHLNILIDGLECEYYLSDYEPIPLSEEWLKRFGFEVIGTYVNEGILVTDYGINITDCNNDEKLIVSDWNMDVSIGEYSEDDYYVCNFNYQYVHQLQNLYHALTGEELEII